MKRLKRIIVNWLFPEMLEANLAWMDRAENWSSVIRKDVQKIQDEINTLKRAYHLNLDWAKELSKTIDVLGTPSHAERQAEKPKKRSRA